MNSNVKELARAPDEGVIVALERLLEMARTGQVIGIVWLTNEDDGYRFNEAGHWSNRDLMMALELRKKQILKCYE